MGKQKTTETERRRKQEQRKLAGITEEKIIWNRREEKIKLPKEEKATLSADSADSKEEKKKTTPRNLAKEEKEKTTSRRKSKLPRTTERDNLSRNLVAGGQDSSPCEWNWHVGLVQSFTETISDMFQ